MIVRLQCAFGADTNQARDRVVMTPHFEMTSPLTSIADWNGLCNDLVDALGAWITGPVREIRVTAYDAQGTPPVYPEGTSYTQLGVFPTSGAPREVACCLSYFSGQNVPRRRGRLFVPYFLIGASPGVKPSTGTMAKVGELADIFANLGAANIDWVVYSRADDDARPVSNWWVDDEWDTIRSRGLRSTARTAGTLSE